MHTSPKSCNRENWPYRFIKLAAVRANVVRADVMQVAVIMVIVVEIISTMRQLVKDRNNLFVFQLHISM